MNSNMASGSPGLPVGHQGKGAARWLIPLLVIIAGIFVLFVSAGLRKPPEPAEEVEVKRTVSVLPVKLDDIQHWIETQGVLTPKTETTLVAEVSGKITRIADSFQTGIYFNAGDVLLEIDPSDYEVALKRAQATLASREAQLAEEVARADQARKDWNNLNRGGQPSDLVLRRPQLADARANVTAAEADVEKAERDLERTRIRAPYDGLVKSRDTDLGQYVTPGASLGTVFATEVAEVRLAINDDDKGFVDWPRPGDASSNQPHVSFETVIAGKIHQWSGRVVRTEAVLDQMTRLTYVVAEISDPYGLESPGSDVPPLSMGSFVSASVEGRVQAQLVRLPRHTLLSDDRVMIMNADDQLEIRPVTVVRTDDESAFVSAGLFDNDRVVTSAIDLPFPGLKLRTEQQSQAQREVEDSQSDRVDADNNELTADVNEAQSDGDSP